MASYHFNAIDDCSSDEEEIDVNKMVETKQAVNKVYSNASFLKLLCVGDQSSCSNACRLPP